MVNYLCNDQTAQKNYSLVTKRYIFITLHAVVDYPQVLEETSSIIEGALQSPIGASRLFRLAGAPGLIRQLRWENRRASPV